MAQAAPRSGNISQTSVKRTNSVQLLFLDVYLMTDRFDE